MRPRLRSPFVLTIAASASLAACGSTSPEPEPVHTVNPPPVAEPEPPGPASNPPPIEVPAALSACPPEAPAVGAACVADLHCHYGSTDPCDAGWVDLRCIDGALQMGPRPTCNPPPPPPPPAATSKR